MEAKWIPIRILCANAVALTALSSLPTPAEDLPPASALETDGAQIGEVIIRSGPVLDPRDPREDGFLHRLANRRHVPTRESAIRAQLLFRPGDRFAQRELEETERNLRSLRFLREPRIRPTCYHDGSAAAAAPIEPTSSSKASIHVMFSRPR